MKKTISCIVMAMLLLLPACSTTKELSQIGVVKGVAYGIGPNGSYEVTLCILNPESEEGFITVSAAGNTIAKAKQNISTRIGKSAFFSQSDLLVLSKELTEQGFREVIDYFVRSEISGNQRLVILEGKAKDAFELSEALYHNPAVAIAVTIDNAEQNSFIIRSDLQDAQLYLKEQGITLIPIGRMNGDKVELTGMGVVRDYKLIGEFGEEESIGVKWLWGRIQNMTLEATVFQKTVAVSVLNSSIQINSPDHIVIAFDFSIAEQSGTTDFNQKDNARLLQRALEKQVYDQVASAINGAKRLNIEPRDIARDGSLTDTDGIQIEVAANIKYRQLQGVG